jgi:hypothetical protein
VDWPFRKIRVHIFYLSDEGSSFFPSAARGTRSNPWASSLDNFWVAAVVEHGVLTVAVGEVLTAGSIRTRRPGREAVRVDSLSSGDAADLVGGGLILLSPRRSPIEWEKDLTS